MEIKFYDKNNRNSTSKNNGQNFLWSQDCQKLNSCSEDGKKERFWRADNWNHDKENKMNKRAGGEDIKNDGIFLIYKGKNYEKIWA
jgi:hypothetical protein